MSNKVLYISIILLFAILNCGYSQKVSLILLPSGSTEIQTYDIQKEALVPVEKNWEIQYFEKTKEPSHDKSKRRRNPENRKNRLCKIIGSFCIEKWSDGLIKLFRLPAASGLTL